MSGRMSRRDGKYFTPGYVPGVCWFGADCWTKNCRFQHPQKQKVCESVNKATSNVRILQPPAKTYGEHSSWAIAARSGFKESDIKEACDNSRGFTPASNEFPVLGSGEHPKPLVPMPSLQLQKSEPEKEPEPEPKQPKEPEPKEPEPKEPELEPEKEPEPEKEKEPEPEPEKEPEPKEPEPKEPEPKESEPEKKPEKTWMVSLSIDVRDIIEKGRCSKNVKTTMDASTQTSFSADEIRSKLDCIISMKEDEMMIISSYLTEKARAAKSRAKMLIEKAAELKLASAKARE